MEKDSMKVGKTDNKQVNRQTDRQTDRQTQTDG